jgi:3-phenylpropionate/trans-cinnamate dioxygenase ferredoxin subunit
MKLVDVCPVEQIVPNRGLAVRAGGKDIALFKVGGEIRAIANACPHQGSALVGGRQCDHVVACPSHGWRLNLMTGALVVAPEVRVETFPVQVRDGRVLVDPGC